MTWRTHAELDDRVYITRPINGISEIRDMQGRHLGEFPVSTTPALVKKPSVAQYNEPLYYSLIALVVVLVLTLTHLCAYNAGCANSPVISSEAKQ